MSDLTPSQVSVNPASKEECIERYKALGLKLFPCGQAGKPKAPKDRNWSITDYSDLSTLEFGSYFGVKPDDTLVILDIDNKEGKQGIEQIKQVWQILALSSPRTFTVNPTFGVNQMKEPLVNDSPGAS